MFQRIKDCLCHPRSIGKYNKDRLGIVILTIFLFFLLSTGMQAARCYTSDPISDSIPLAITSSIIRDGDLNVQYSSSEHKLKGNSKTIEGKDISLYILPSENERITYKLDKLIIILKEEEALLYYSSQKASSISYQDMQVKDFDLGNVASNNPTDTYHFRTFIDYVFDSAKLFFQTFDFIQSFGSTILYYLICVFFSYILSVAVNPTINRGVRAKLCFYDGCVFFIGTFFAYLFNIDIIIYFALMLPLIYTLITFRHIIKVVIRR
ncbi:MAG: hypothetical protein K2O22_01980 [Anaeroplasmataceae bacterium]|nr:hypothetical protein [Anaeroplasmataceae bacterium]